MLDLTEVLAAHDKWVRGEAGGKRAQLSGVDLRYVDFRSADLRGASFGGTNFDGANFKGANLDSANFGDADLRGANLRGANLGCANLDSANFGDADLRGASLRDAKLGGASLVGAKVHNVGWPAPAMVLLAQWGTVSDALCRDLMRYDAANHPDPKAFDLWNNSGICPYVGVRWQRSARFNEQKSLWTPDLLRKRPRSALELAQRLIAEKCDTSENCNE